MMLKYDIEKIFEVVLAFNSTSNQTELLDIILTKIMEITYSDSGTLYTVDDEKLYFRIIRNKTLGIFQSSDEINLPPIKLDKYNIKNVSAYSAITNEIVIVDDVYNSNDFSFSGPRNYDKLTGYCTRTMLVLPMCTHNETGSEVVGVIQLMNTINPETGEPSVYGNIYEPPIVPALSNIAANTLSNLTYVKELHLMFHSIAAVMTQTIDERSPYNNNHTQNVAKYCERFAKYLSEIFPKGHKFHFDKKHIEGIVLAGLLHDIGKIVTPLYIMDKPNRLGSKLEIICYRFELKRCQLEIDWLNKCIDDEQYANERAWLDKALLFTEDLNIASFVDDDDIKIIKKLEEMTYKNAKGEFVPIFDRLDIDSLSVRRGTITVAERDIMQQHVVVTNKLLNKIPFWKYFGNIPMWAGSHHEFLDGTGYPNRLSGDKIPIESCIITIMDIFDALIAKDRPYKKGIPLEKALNILMEMANEGKLHKELVKLFAESKIWEGV